MTDELKRSEVLSFVDGTLSVKMSGYGRADKWGVLKFDEEQIETKPHDDRDGNYIEIEIPPTELLEIRDFLNRITGSKPQLLAIDQSLCAQCGSWRSRPCGEGCTWGTQTDAINGGFKVSETVLEWYYKDWHRTHKKDPQP